MLFEIIIITITIIVLLISSYSDIKTREVPDWVSYGLIFIALAVRALFSIDSSWYLFLSGLFGFGVCFGLAYLLYYTSQWGGGDSKLLMGIGAVIGITVPFNDSSYNLLVFFIALLFVGAIYGVIYMSILAIIKRHSFKKAFVEKLNRLRILHFIIVLTSAVFLILTFFYNLLWPLILIPIILFYLFTFITSVEKSCFFNKIEIPKLTEGDWLAKKIIINKKTVMSKKTLERHDLNKLRELHQKGKIKTVLIKSGIPFIPAFLLGYLFFVFGEPIWSWLFKLIL